MGAAVLSCSLLHTIAYLDGKAALAIAGSGITKAYIWTGWIAFLVFVPPAITLTDGWVRILGPQWKTLQHFVDLAAGLTLRH